MNEDEPTWKTTLPFPRRWLYYLVLKLCVVAVATMAVLRMMGYV
jgi:hypothetical protein